MYLVAYHNAWIQSLDIMQAIYGHSSWWQIDRHRLDLIIDRVAICLRTVWPRLNRFECGLSKSRIKHIVFSLPIPDRLFDD